MDNVTKSRIHNVMYRYSIKENMDNFNKIAEHINGKQIDLYKVIFSILENCIIVHENAHSLKIEICSEEYRHLLEDISKLSFLKLQEEEESTSRRIYFLQFLYINNDSCK